MVHAERGAARPRVGVALGGGGAWAFAHCALLRGLASRGIPVDMVAGASFGSVVGAFYAARGLEGLDALIRIAPRIGALLARCVISSAPIERFVDAELGGVRIEELAVTFLPVAVDLTAGRESVVTTGSVGAGVRASSAFPGIWGPVLRGDARYVDGSIANNVPVSCLVDAGADIVIASSVMQPPSPRRPRSSSALGRAWSEVSPFARVRDARRAARIFWCATSRQQAAAADVAFVPDLAGLRIVDWAAAPRIEARAASQLGPTLDASAAAVASL